MPIWLTIILNVSGILLVIIGWKVIYANAKRIASRNEVHSLILRGDSALEALYQLTENYWLAPRYEDGNSNQEAVNKFACQCGQSISSLRMLEALLNEHSPLICYKFNIAELRMIVTTDSEYKNSPDTSKVIQAYTKINAKRLELYTSFRAGYSISI